MDSIARTAIFPLQDVLGLGAEARMNTPSTCVDNWKWRLLPGAIAPETVQWLAELTRSCSRANAETEYVPQFLPDYPPTLPE
jgi:4-alpha-glucanotransferase